MRFVATPKLERFLVIPLLIVGGASGYLAVNSYRGFIAELALPVEPVRYRSTESAMESIIELRQFAKVAGRSESQEFRQLETQVLGLASTVTFEVEQRIQKRDWREAPEGMVQRLFEPGSNDQGPGSNDQGPASNDTGIIGALNGKVLELVVSTWSKDEGEAFRLTQFAMDYFRYVMHKAILREQLVKWGPASLVELALISEQATITESNIFELDQKIAALRELSDRNKNLPPIPAVAFSGLQLQVNTLRILSPQQQIVGLESDRIELLSIDNENQIRAAFLAIMIQIANEFLPKIDAGQSPETLIKQITERMTKLPAPNSTIERFAIQRARAAVDVALRAFEARWLEARTDPVVPLARSAGPSAFIGLVAGIAFGLLLWVVALNRDNISRICRRLANEA